MIRSSARASTPPIECTNDPNHRGVVIKIPDATPGLIVAGGEQYSFLLPDVWQGPAAPALNQKVLFTLGPNGTVATVHVLGRDVLTNEALAALGQTVRSHGDTLREKMLPLLNKQKDRMTTPGVILAGLLLLGVFVLPGWSLAAGNTMLGINLAYTVSQLLGVEVGESGPTVHFGFWRLVECFLVILPWITPRLTFKGARLLNLLPFVFLAALPLVVHARLRHFAAEAEKSTGQLFGGPGGTAALQKDMQAMVEKQTTALIDATSWNSGYWLALFAALGIAALTVMRKTRI